MKFSKKIILVVLILGLLMSSTVLAWTAYEKSIKVKFAQIVLNVSGKEIKTNAEPFIYNDNVYAPVATIANALNINWEWDNSIPSVFFYDDEYQLMEENDISGSLNVKSLGQGYYYYNETGIHYISKGLKYQNNDSVIVEIPSIQIEGYSTDDQFYMPITEFIDIDKDGKKNELLVTSILYPDHQDMERKFLTYAIKLLNEGEFEFLDSVLTGSVPINNSYHFDSATKRLFIHHYEEDAKTISTIEIYEWQQGFIELTQSLAAGPN